jgi:L-aspartate oxidase
VTQIRKTNFTHVFLDVRHLPTEKFVARFPQLAGLCKQFDIDIARDLIPIHPATHYMIGGVDADELGKTSLAGLYAVGEASCSGLHGANRLASNSLLEGLVYGTRAGKDAAEAAKRDDMKFPQNIDYKIPASDKTELDIVDVRNSLRSVMWRNVGIEREADGLRYAMDSIGFWSGYVLDAEFDEPGGWELQNMLQLGRLMAWAALKRHESRGVHYRHDYPRTDDKRWRSHLVLVRDGVKSHQYRMESRTWPTLSAGR